MKKINYLVIAAFFVMSMFVVSCGGASDEEAEALASDLIESLDNAMDDVNTETSAEKFYSEDGKFKVNFAGTPEITSESVATEVGSIEIFMFMYEKSLTEIELLAYSDYPSALVEMSDEDKMLQDAKTGAISNLEASIVEEKEITYKGYKGLEFKANSAQIYVNYKIFLVKNRLYQIGLMRDGSFASEENVNKLFDSFELIEE